MSRDTILTAEDGTRYSFDNLATQKWLEGRIRCPICAPMRGSKAP